MTSGSPKFCPKTFLLFIQGIYKMLHRYTMYIRANRSSQAHFVVPTQCTEGVTLTSQLCQSPGRVQWFKSTIVLSWKTGEGWSLHFKKLPCVLFLWMDFFLAGSTGKKGSDEDTTIYYVSDWQNDLQGGAMQQQYPSTLLALFTSRRDPGHKQAAMSPASYICCLYANVQSYLAQMAS